MFPCVIPDRKHPIELVKTRMQLQGELTQTYKKHYAKNFASARLIAQTDGLRGLYSGLTAGITYQAGVPNFRCATYTLPYHISLM